MRTRENLIKKISKKFSLAKRGKFVLIVAILTSGLLTIQLLEERWRYPTIGIFVLTTYFLTAWGLRENLGGIEWLTLFILPTMYAASIPLFYFLLPGRWLTRLPTALVFALGMYAILLVENIYNVAAIRTIQLLRAAHSVGLLLTLWVSFLFFALIFSFRLPSYWNLLLVFVISFPLGLQSLWAMTLKSKIEHDILLYTIVTSVVLFQLAFVFSFWPVQTIIEALFLTTVFYTLLGIIQQYLVGRLFRRTMVEFITVSGIVFILVLLTTRWGG